MKGKEIEVREDERGAQRGRELLGECGLGLANTGENSIEVQCVSITILLAFERNRKSLKGEVLSDVVGSFGRLAMLAQDDNAHRMVSRQVVRLRGN